MTEDPTDEPTQPAAGPSAVADVPADDPAAVPTAVPAEGLRRAGSVRRVLTRVATAVAALALVAAAVLADDVLPRPAPVPAAAADLAVPPAPATVVCPGPLRLPTEPEPGGDLTYDPQFDPSPEDSATRLSAVAEETAGVELRTLGEGATTSGGGLAVAAADLAAGAVVTAIPGTATDDDAVAAPQVAAGVVTLTSSGDLRGLAAAGCTRPAAELWLAGGSTTLGSSARLVLQNPGATAVTVGLDLWGPGGPVELAGAPQFLVPPGQERVVLLEGLAAEERRVVVRVTAAGGLVTAHLQDSALRGVVPAGVDQVVPGAAPATRQVLTGVVVPATDAGTADTAQLRLLAPEESTTASVALLGPEGPVDLPGLAEVDLDAGAVLDVPLAALPAGAWTVVVDAAAPVVAGAMVTSGTGVGAAAESRTAPLDRAWVPAATTAPSATVVLPGGGGALEGLSRTVVLALVDPPAGQDVRATAAATLELVDDTGTVLGTADVTLDRGTTLRLDLAELAERAGLPEDAAVTAVRSRTESASVVLGGVLVASAPDGDLVSVVAATPDVRARAALRVDLR
ncbi:DUF5719 family protein [Actinotalea sp. Marseille-Q4924]|uniref:DUF5719 family protein n=1 Tax=Actinotalea sp. Marseille-Q4924 TaxID=2866571 RepID=UPI001CE44B18|nr:DUF5719 family protein [Actinotalea sp. Marseille-Q4924]